MKDSIKYQKGSTIVSELKAVSSVVNRRKTKVFLYGFVFSFVACTAYLAFFNPSAGAGFGTGVPWFNNLFSSAASSTAPYRSQISNYFSHFLPNSSSLSPPEEGIQAGKSGALAGGNGATKEGIRFEPGGDTRNKSVKESRFKPTKDQSLETKKESTVGSQESGASGKNITGTKPVGAALSNSTKLDGSLKQSERTASTGTPPVVTSIPAKKDSNTKKESDNGNHAASGTPATQEVKEESGSKKDGNDEKKQRSNGTASKNQTSNVSHGNSPAPTNLARTVPAASDGSGNQVRTGSSPTGNSSTVTKGQSNSGSQSNNAQVPSGSKTASPDTKSSSQAAINSKASEKTTSSKNFTASLAKGNEGSKGSYKTAPNTDPSKKDILIKSMIGCDMFQGQWVKDDSYPLYPEGSCPHIDEPFDCYHNGRPDRSYQKLRWQPHGCKIPRYKFDLDEIWKVPFKFIRRYIYLLGSSTVHPSIFVDTYIWHLSECQKIKCMYNTTILTFWK
jgi:PMR5 N terminal Domain